METTSETTNRIPTGQLFVGMALVAVGVLSFLNAIDVLNFRVSQLVRLWPLVLIFIGLSSEISALRQRKSDGGFILIAVGVWMLAGTLHLFGLSMFEAMPLGVAVAGLGLVVHAIADRPVIHKKENDNDHQ